MPAAPLGGQAARPTAPATVEGRRCAGPRAAQPAPGIPSPSLPGLHVHIECRDRAVVGMLLGHVQTRRNGNSAFVHNGRCDACQMPVPILPVLTLTWQDRRWFRCAGGEEQIIEHPGLLPQRHLMPWLFASAAAAAAILLGCLPAPSPRPNFGGASRRCRAPLHRW